MDPSLSRKDGTRSDTAMGMQPKSALLYQLTLLSTQHPFVKARPELCIYLPEEGGEGSPSFHSNFEIPNQWRTLRGGGKGMRSPLNILEDNCLLF